MSQLGELETTSKEDLRENLELLADKLNTAQETQEDLTARAEVVIKVESLLTKVSINYCMV